MDKAIKDDNSRNFIGILKTNIQTSVVFIALVVIVIFFSIATTSFATIGNLEVILRQVSILAILSFGMTFVISSAGIDLSVGSIIALTGMISALAINAGSGILVASLLGIGVGTAFGLFNGAIISFVRLPPFLVTLGSMSMVRGIAMVITGTYPVPLTDKSFSIVWGNGNIFGIPAIILWAALFFVIMHVLYRNTPFGNFVCAIGGNETAARYAGVKVAKNKALVYVINGFLAGVAGMLMLARLSTGRCDLGTDSAMDSITAVILGGTSLFGGRGSIVFSLVGALILTVLTNGLVIMGVDSNYQLIIKGAIVILAVSFSEKR